MAEGLRTEGDRRRLTRTVFLVGGGVEKGECRRVGESDRGADGIVHATRGVFKLGGECTGTLRKKKERATYGVADDDAVDDDDCDRE